MKTLKNLRYFALCLLASVLASSGHAQHTVVLDLKRTIGLASDSSLTAFRNQNMYLSGYWAYRTYKANRLPSLSLNLTPAQYYRYITQRYDSNADMDVYREQQMFSAGGGLTLQQNFDLTGGTFYLESDLEYMRNFGDTKSTQYSSVPVRVGYTQSLLGYNPFRWERKIEPLKYEKVKKEFKKGMQYMVTAGFGVHTCQAEWNKYAYKDHLSAEPVSQNPTKEEAESLKAHPKFSLSFDAVYRYSLRYATGLGVDMFYSSNIKELEAADRVLYGDEAVDNCPGYSPISLGIAVLQEVYFRNFAVHIAIGAYPYRHKGVNDKALNDKFDDRERGWHYEKAGFRYYFPKLGDTFLGFAIKSHSIKAEYLEFSAGVRF